MTSAKVAVPVLQAFLDAFNAHDLDVIMSFFAEDCVIDMPRGPGPGAGGWWARTRSGRASGRGSTASRTSTTATTATGSCGDRGVSEWTIRGTQATGERIEVRGCDLFEFVDGKISRKDSFWKIVD